MDDAPTDGTEDLLDTLAGRVLDDLRAVETRIESGLEAQRLDLQGMLAAFGDALVAKVSSTVGSEADATHAAVHAEVTGLAERLGAVVDALSGTPGEVAEVVARMADASDRSIGDVPEAVGDRVHDRITPEFAAVGDRLDDVAAAVLALGERLAGVDDTLRRLEGATARVGADATAAVEAVRQEVARSAASIASSGTGEAAAVADRMWADTTRALEAFAGEARLAMEAATSAVAGAEAAAERAARAAGEAARQGSQAEAALRTELVGLRLAVRAALGEVRDELGRTVHAQVEGLTPAGTGTDLDALIDGVRSRVDDLDANTRSSHEALVAEVRAAVAAIADVDPTGVEHLQRELLSGVREAVGDTERTVARLLLDQLSALDQRQGILEDGLRAVWTRLDQFEQSVDRLASASGATSEQLIEAVGTALAGSADQVAATARSSVTTLVSGMTSAVGELMSGVPAQVSDAVASVPDRVVAEMGDAVAGLAASLESTVVGAGDRVAAELRQVLDSLPPRFEAVLAGAVSEAVAGLPDRAAAELGAHLASRLAPTIEALPDDLTEVVRGLPDYIGAQVADVVEALPERMASRLDGTIAALSDRIAAQVAEAVATVPAGVNGALDTIPDRLAAAVGIAVLDAISDLPARVAGGLETLPDQVATEVAATLAGVPEQFAGVGEEVARQVGEDVRRVVDEDSAVRGDQAAEAVRAAMAEVMEANRDSLESAIQSLTASSARVSEDLDRAISERMTAAVTSAVTDAMDDLVPALVTAIDARPVNAAPAIGPDDLVAVVDALRMGIDEAAGSAARSAAEQVRGAGNQAAVEAAAAAGQAASDAAAERVTALMDERRGGDVDAIEDVLHAALGGLGDTLAERLEAVGRAVEEAVARGLAAGLQSEVAPAVGSAVESATDRAVAAAVEAAVAEAVTSAVADAVGTGLESLTSTLDTTVNRVAPSTPDLTAGMVSAVAATLDEFGTRVDHDLDTMADRLERLSDVLERVVVTVDEVVSRRRGVPSEAIVLLRQVAAETTEQIRTDNRSRRGGAGGAFPTPPSAEQG